GGLNPRTAIGQRADGAVLLLVIDGRQPHSLGANLKDLADIMIEHGAINAGNLDGGSSTMMYYEGKLANTCASLYGPRKIPNGFLVR
ncbi:MAG: phosphodiester glycosidase family protein, partial [Oscillospiraceae bacterium]